MSVQSEQVNFQEQTKGTQSVLRFTNRQCRGDCTVGRAVVREQPQLKACSHTLSDVFTELLRCLQGTETWWELGQLEALCVEAVPFFAGDSFEQALLLLHAPGGFQLIHGGQVEEHTLVQVVLGVLLHHGLQLPQGVLELAQVKQTHGSIVVGLQERTRAQGGTACSWWSPVPTSHQPLYGPLWLWEARPGQSRNLVCWSAKGRGTCGVPSLHVLPLHLWGPSSRSL